MKLSVVRVAVTLGVAFAATYAGATARTWTGGAGDGKYTSASNWNPSGSPANNNYGDTVTFNAGACTVSIDAGRTINATTVKTPGWTFTGNGLMAKKHTVSADCGEITAANFGLTDANNQGYSIGSGSTLKITGGVTVQNTSTPQVSGGGTLHLKSKFSFNCYAAGGAFEVNGNSCLITDQTLANFGSVNGNYAWTIKLKSEGATFRCKSTVAQVRAKFGTSTKNAWNLANAYNTTTHQLDARELSGDWAGYVEVFLSPKGAPLLDSASLARTDAGVYEVTARMADGVDGTTVKAVADDGAGNAVETTYSGAITVNEDFTFPLVGLASGSTYTVKVVATNPSGTSEKSIPDVFYNGNLGLALTADAYERNTVAGTVTVSRATADASALTVNYAFAGVTAVEGVDYVKPSGVVTIPAGAASADIIVQPIMNAAKTEDTTLSVSLASGLYGASAEPVTVTIHDFTIPTDACVWMGNSGVDNKASTAANWHQSKLPTVADKILLAAFSPSNLVWDAGVNGLPDTVAAWEQTVDYTGTVTIKTVYPVDGVNDAFTNFTVTGDCVINGGQWTHTANNEQQLNRLCVSVGGNLTVGADGAISAQGKGYAPGKFPSGSAVGAHAAVATGNASHLYGDVKAPTCIGSGGDVKAASCGGGAILFVVGGAAVIDGTLDAQSSTQTSAKSGNPEKGVGAGGSIFVTAASISGSGAIVASAYEANGTSYTGSAGSGGRIALVATSSEVTFPLGKIRISGSHGSNAVGGGTAFVKNVSDANGTLYLRDAMAYSVFDYAQHWPTKETVTMIPAGETWTFDRVVFNGNGILAVVPGTTLSLPNGFASVSALAPAASPECGILYRGGTIDVPETDTHQLEDGWLFQAETAYAFPTGAVTLANFAGIGCFRLMAASLEAQPGCKVTVNGDLTIPSGCGLVGEGRGFRSVGVPGNNGAHGGVAAGFDGQSFDSILNPALAGASAGTGNGGVDNNLSGAAITLSVHGLFTMNGSASVKASRVAWGAARAGAGTLNITAKQIAGAGSFTADGMKTENSNGLSGAGGRIAIRLTDEDATFDDFPVGNITADAAIYSTGKGASAGTIYLQSGADAEGAGVVVVKAATDVPVATPIPSPSKGGENDDLRKAQLSVQGYGRAQLTAAVKMTSLEVGANGKLDLNGKTLKVFGAKLGDTKLKPGTYTATSAEVKGFVTDSGEGGELIVQPSGLVILVQ